MRVRNTLYAVLFMLLFAVSSADAGAPVWKVSKDGNQLYIGGTIHVLGKTDYPLPAAFDAAYRQAERVVFETDLQKIKSPEVQQKLAQTMFYTDGRSLQQALDKQTFAELERYLASRGIPAATVLSFKPGMLALTLTIIELRRLGLGGAGVDEFYNTKALADHKKLGQLESVEQQLSFIAAMGEGNENDVINHTLRDLKELPRIMQSLKDAWRSGDINRLQEVGLKSFKQDSQALYDKLIVQRNNAWIPQLEALLKTGEVELVLVGALHLAGDEGVLAQLARRGYTVQMLD